MQSGKLLTLVGVTVLVAAGAVAATLMGPRQKVDPQTGKRVLPAVEQKLGDISKLALTKAETKLTLQKKGEAWVVVEKNDYPADPVKVRQALLGLSQLTYVEPKTSNAQRYSRIRVEDAGKAGSESILIVASDAKGGAIGEEILGRRRVDQLGGGNDGIYVRGPTEAQSWLARGTLDVNTDPVPWLEKKLVDIDGTKLKRVVLTQGTGEKLAVSREKPESPFAIENAPKDIKLRTESAPGEPSYGLAGLELTDVRQAQAFPFPDANFNVAEFETFDGLQVRVELFSVDTTDWARIKATGTGAAEAQAKDINDRLTPWVFSIPNYKARSMKAKLQDLLETPKGS